MKQVTILLLIVMFTVISYAQDVLFNSITQSEIKAAKLTTSTSLNVSTDSTSAVQKGSILLYQTKNGRYGKLRVIDNNIPTWDLKIKFITYDSAGAVYKKSDSLAIPSSWFADLDSAKLTTAFTNADIWWSPQSSIKRNLLTRNSAKIGFFDQKFDTLPMMAIQKTSLSSSAIAANADVSNKLPAGTVVVYKTNQGRFGKFKVLTYGQDLIVKWVTYDSAGGIRSRGDSLSITGTWLCDLDSGKVTGNFATADLKWNIQSFTERSLVPQVNAQFSVWYVPAVYYVNAATGNNTTGNGSAGSPFKTITKALAVSGPDGDSIKVAPGTYNVALGEVFPIEILTGRKLIGTAGAAATIIDATGSFYRVMNCDGNSNTTIIQGFTITGGFANDTSSGGVTSKGGGIFISNGSRTIIQRNIIKQNLSRGYDFYQAGLGALNGGTCQGGGIFVQNASPTIRNNVISENVALAGGGKDFRGGWSGNGSAGGNADGGGIYAAGGDSALIFNNTFYGNKAIGGMGGSSNSLNAGWGGNAASGALNAGSSSIVKNNIFYNNAALEGSTGGGANGSNGTATNGAVTTFTAANLSHNLYFKNAALTDSNGNSLGSNNVFSDPLFVSSTNFQLQSLSPARMAGTAAGAPTTDFNGTTRGTPPSIGAFEGSPPTSVNDGDNSNRAPVKFGLEQNYPNPFNPTTTIGFTIPAAAGRHVSVLTTLKIYDVLGKEAATLVNENLEAGVYHHRTFDASNLAAGVYFYTLRSGDLSDTKKLVLVK